jgi:hypothetical protein
MKDRDFDAWLGANACISGAIAIGLLLLAGAGFYGQHFDPAKAPIAEASTVVDSKLGLPMRAQH